MYPDAHDGSTENAPPDMERLPQRMRHRFDPANSGTRGLPAWLRETAGENRIPVAVAVLVAAALQAVLPSRFVLEPRWVLPALELALLAVLVVANPVRLTRSHRSLRLMSLGLTGVVTAANGLSAVLLIRALLTGRASNDPGVLLGSGAAIYLTNVIAFGLWYWEFDRGGAFERMTATKVYPDFLFPQMATPELAPEHWEPGFLDYLYVSFTNATAFSPTDTLPLSRWAKILMLLQSAIALTTVGLVIARAVNVLR